MSGHNTALDGELERRMAIIESADYDDPAREDLPWGDIVALTVLVALIVLISWVVLY